MVNRALPALLLSLLPLVANAGDPAETAVQAAILRRVEVLRTDGELRIRDSAIASRMIVPSLYERRGYAPTWREPGRVEALLSAIDGSERHGLDPEDYHRAAIRALRPEATRPGADPGSVADLEVLLTDATVRLAYQLDLGKVDPERLDPNWNLARDLEDLEPVSAIQEIIDSDDLEAELAEIAPQDPFYANGMLALARYREIEGNAGWEPVPAGATLRRGAEGERVVALRRRLAATGDLAADSVGSPDFDADLEAAVKRFQRRHFLEPDGVVGAGSLEAMNVPVEARIDQIRVNLERGRWVLQEPIVDGVMVDIAGFRVQLLRDGAPVWESRVQIGRPYRRTPVFRDRIRYLEFNPTWTVPPGILRRDVLPAIQRDVGFLASRNMQVVAGDGTVIDPASIDWSRYPEERFPYRIVQAPGPRNALGLVKFMFPNPHLVFLHDTPSRALFARADRAFSSGCIRVQRPFELARLLLDDEERWSAGKIRQTVDAEQTTVVVLDEPFPVYLLYWTADFDDPEQTGFKRDVYQRDPRILEVLNGGFRFRERPVGGRERL